MMKAQKELVLDQFHGMNLRERGNKIPLREASFTQNVWINDASGAIETRPGFVNDPRVDNDFGVKITGVARFYASASSKQSLAYAYDSGDTADRLYYISGGAWTDTGIGFTASNRVPDIQVLNLPTNKLYVANGADLLASWDGSTGASITIDGSFHPEGLDQVAGHLLAFGREQPGRVYYNTVAGDTSAWSQLTFYMNDSTWVTGVLGWEGHPLVWTHNSMFAIQGFPNNIRVSEINPGYGCMARRTIVRRGGEVFWAGRGPEGFGVFRWNGGRPVDISGKIWPRLSAVDAANVGKSWAMAFEKWYLLFYPNSSDGTGEPSRCLAYHTPTGRWYEWSDMNFACGVWQNADTDTGQLYLGGATAGTDGAFRIYKWAGGPSPTFGNPFDANGIEMIWDTADIDMGDIHKPKQFLYYQPRFKVLGSGSFNVGTITPTIDDTAMSALSVDVSDAEDQVIAIQDDSGNLFPSGHWMRTRIRTRGTKGLRYDSLKIGYEIRDVQNIAG